jgi:hypothetical protein
MRNLVTLTALTLILVTAVLSAAAQSPQAATPATGSKPALARVLGEVAAVDAAGRKLTLKTDDGKSVAVSVNDQTVYRRVPPGETTLDKATATTLAEISVADRVLARGRVENESVVARDVIVMPKADLAQQQARAREEWQRRGILGQITALNPERHEITLLARTREGASTVTLAAGERVSFRRYAPDSIRYRDARASTFAELKVGDQLRALGERSADGKSFTPEEIVSGTFRTISGRVTAVDAQKGELTITNVQNQQPLTIVVNAESKLRRLPGDLAKELEQIVARGSAAPPSDGQRTEDVQETINQLPPIAIGDLKPGDAVIVSSTQGSDPARATALIVAAGAEAVLKRLQQQPARRDLNLGLGLPSGINP